MVQNTVLATYAYNTSEKAVDVSLTSLNVIVTTNQNRVLIWGAPGAAGFNPASNSFFTIPFELVTPGARAASFAGFKGAGSGSTSMIVVTDGCTYPIVTPTAVNITKTYQLTCNGTNQVYGMGNVHGQGVYLNPSTEMTSIDNETIVDLQTGNGNAATASAYGFTVALTASGNMYAWGTNTNGTVGDGTTNNVLYPKLIPWSNPIVMISCAYMSCIAVANDNTLLGWGYARSPPALGTPDKVPTPINKGAIGTRAISKIASGNNFHLVLTTDNKIFSWGMNTYGSLGDGMFPVGAACTLHYII
jgi:alpha-tubulin suppressor-like RCC1 family protein